MNRSDQIIADFEQSLIDTAVQNMSPEDRALYQQEQARKADVERRYAEWLRS